jgi:hypothetical protein
MTWIDRGHLIASQKAAEAKARKLDRRYPHVEHRAAPAANDWRWTILCRRRPGPAAH